MEGSQSNSNQSNNMSSSRRSKRKKPKDEKPRNCVEMVRVIRALPWPVISRLSDDHTSAEMVELYVASWVQWTLTQEITRTWSGWRPCHEDFKEYVDKVINKGS